MWTLPRRGETNEFVQGWRLISPTSSITLNVRTGSGADENPIPRLRLLLRVKRTKSARKPTSASECRLLGDKRTWLVRGCQDRS